MLSVLFSEVNKAAVLKTLVLLKQKSKNQIYEIQNKHLKRISNLLVLQIKLSRLSASPLEVKVSDVTPNQWKRMCSQRIVNLFSYLCNT